MVDLQAAETFGARLLIIIMKTYSEKLKDPRWQRKRLEIMERDEFSCANCGDDKSTLNVHHHFYTKGANPWEYDNKDLSTLCQTCHEYIEEMGIDLLSKISSFTALYAAKRIFTYLDFGQITDLATMFSENNSKRSIDAKLRASTRVNNFINQRINQLKEIAQNED